MPYSPTWVPVATAEPFAAAAGARRKRVRLWAGTLAAALLVGGGATAGVMLLKDGAPASESGDRKPTPAASGASPGTPSQVTPAVPTAQAEHPATRPPSGEQPPATLPAGTPTPDAPPGFRRVDDPAGFSFAIPSVWGREKEVNGQITYAGSTGMSHILVGVVRNAPYTSLGNLTTIEAKSRAKNADYRRLQLAENTFHGRPGAIWEYTYTDAQSGETIHGIDQSYVAEDGTEYAIYFTERDLYWPDAKEVFETALSTWTTR
ncbi:hypothetical protein [Streptomyces sp. NPDC059176]|uniref:hypothetical protein n=1 Tax=unclassified Streptomyces TaxID=2593676 RepID=UPI00367840BD